MFGVEAFPPPQYLCSDCGLLVTHTLVCAAIIQPLHNTMYLRSRIDDVRRYRHLQKPRYSSKLGSWIHFQILIEHYQHWSTRCNGLHIITYHQTPLLCLFFH